MKTFYYPGLVSKDPKGFFVFIPDFDCTVYAPTQDQLLPVCQQALEKKLQELLRRKPSSAQLPQPSDLLEMAKEGATLLIPCHISDHLNKKALPHWLGENWPVIHEGQQTRQKEDAHQ